MRRDLERMAPRKSYKAELLMLGRYDDDKSFNEIIEDPYYVSASSVSVRAALSLLLSKSTDSTLRFVHYRS